MKYIIPATTKKERANNDGIKGSKSVADEFVSQLQRGSLYIRDYLFGRYSVFYGFFDMGDSQ
ncbi:hypothetical protein LQ318_10495 [Aliifodinibius salicampi]|uniref:Uncharacterized protein n=1 Tax=Fodinibius salicampi TaxID=1920655 RepID=A0ABT3PZS9_9BACT|nr:hypothetical protein [Fodinibius salicampi]MCW9713336.1 hypothetical protein [Fodinibius salicampi]